MIGKDSFRTNNFDLIRLFAALEVAVHHTLHHFKLTDHWLYHSTSWLPGVPIFFFVSGFLISKSYENNSRIVEYGRNRALRIYPALVLCTILAVASAFMTGYLATQSWGIPEFLAWIASQVTIVQFFSPEFMRGFGSGVLNGSLWTVTVELQFYVLIPCIYWALSRATKNPKSRTAMLVVTTLVFAAFNVAYQWIEDARPDAISTKLANVSFLPWIYMFLLGVLAQQNFGRIHPLVQGRAIPIVCVYGAIAFVAIRLFGWETGNAIGPALFPFVAITVLSLAYSAPTLSDRLLRKNDISYGVYIYHMPIINVMMYYGLVGTGMYAVWALGGTVIVAICSWVFVERVAIRKKKRPLMALSVKPVSA